MANNGALKDLRVIDLTDDTGRFATKLLAEAGADVIRVGHGAAGTAMSGAADQHGGLLDWWYDNNKQRLQIDLESTLGQSQFRDLAAGADVLLETEPPGRLAGLGLDYTDLNANNTRLVHVSLTPFGRQGPWANWQVSDLVASALGGMLSVTGTPDAPLNNWGRQSFNIGGYFAAISGLAGVYAARQSGRGQHIDLSLHQSIISCTEHVLMFWFFQHILQVAIAPRQAALHWSRAFDVMPCATGHAMITPALHTDVLIEWMEENNMAGILKEMDFSNILQLIAQIGNIMKQMRAWAATQDAKKVFLGGQQRRLPFGDVQTIAEASQSPQFQTRGFFRAVEGDSSAVQIPGPLFRTKDTPAPVPQAPTTTDIDTVLQRWTPQEKDTPSDSARAKPLAGVRILDFTWVLAGPFATRILADLGAEVIKIQTASRSQAANANEHPYFVMWNRGKRSVNLDMKHPKAAEIFRQLVKKADVVVENYSAGVLDRWGIGYETAKQWNDQIIYLGMAGAGQDGPWSDFVTFAPTIHALCGLTYLTNPPDRKDIGTGLALTDHTSGLSGAVAILEALEARRRIGHGQYIDLSQLEVGAYLLGPAFVDFLSNGQEAQPAGNRDGFVDYVPNEVYKCCNDAWLAITVRDEEEWKHLCEMIGDTELGSNSLLATVEGRRQQRDEINARLRAWAAGQDAEQAMRQLQSVGVPAGKVQNAKDFVEKDEQLAARQWLTAARHQLHGTQHIDRFPAEFTGTPLDSYTASPFFGQHNFEVYAKLLGMSQEEVAEAIGDGLFV